MKLLIASVSVGAMFTHAVIAEEVKIGVLLSFTGPLESLTPAMGDSADLAIKEVSDSGLLLGGATVVGVRGDATCIDAAAAVAAAESLVTVDQVNAIVGADCSGATGAVLQNVGIPNGIVMISPASTSPGLSTIEDNGLFFRTAPSDTRQGAVLADLAIERGYKSLAVTYVNNDYGKGLADSFNKAFTAAGGEVTIVAAHENEKADYSAEVASLDAAGGEALLLIGYLGQGGQGMIRGVLDAGSFETFLLPDGMIGELLIDAFGSDLNGSFGTLPGTDSPGAQMLNEIVAAAGLPQSDVYVAETYDSAALLLLAMQAANSSASADLKDKIMSVANAPGEKIYPGELAKALQILSDGGEIDYEGASAVELIEPGESAGNYAVKEIQNAQYVTIGYR